MQKELEKFALLVIKAMKLDVIKTRAFFKDNDALQDVTHGECGNLGTKGLEEHVRQEICMGPCRYIRNWFST